MRLINDQCVKVTVKWLWLDKYSPCKNEDNHAVEDQSCKTQQRQNDSIDGLHHVNWTEPVRHIYLIAIVIWTSKRNWKISNQINLSSSVFIKSYFTLKSTIYPDWSPLGTSSRSVVSFIILQMKLLKIIHGMSIILLVFYDFPV